MRRLLFLGALVLLAGGLGAGLTYSTGRSPLPSTRAQEGSICEKALPWFKKACERDEARALAEGGTFSVAASTWHQHRDYPIAGFGGQEGETVIYAHPRYGYIGEVFLEPEAQRQIRAAHGPLPRAGARGLPAGAREGGRGWGPHEGPRSSGGERGRGGGVARLGPRI